MTALAEGLLKVSNLQAQKFALSETALWETALAEGACTTYLEVCTEYVYELMVFLFLFLITTHTKKLAMWFMSP